jgi:hypothetical protein
MWVYNYLKIKRVLKMHKPKFLHSSIGKKQVICKHQVGENEKKGKLQFSSTKTQTGIVILEKWTSESGFRSGPTVTFLPAVEKQMQTLLVTANTGKILSTWQQKQVAILKCL